MSSGVWKKIADAENLKPGEILGAEVDGAHVAVFNVEGTLYATSNICTHAFTYLSEGYLEECIIECPLHAGRFDVRTGKGQGAPVTTDLQTFNVRQSAEGVEIEFP